MTKIPSPRSSEAISDAISSALASPDGSAGQALNAIATQMTFAQPPARAWVGLMFYEQIDARPPFYLRLLLPVPIRTEGRKSEVGDEARCIYEGGYLVKRITRVERNRHYGFEVVEQALAVGPGMRLFGGSYSLREISDGRTEITLVTNYQSSQRPRWLWKPIEAVVGHLFHRHILSAMRRSFTSR